MEVNSINKNSAVYNKPKVQQKPKPEQTEVTTQAVQEQSMRAKDDIKVDEKKVAYDKSARAVSGSVKTQPSTIDLVQ